MSIHQRFVLVTAVVGCCSILLGCAWPFGANGPKDVRVTSVSEVDFKDQPEIEYVSQKPRPSIILSRIDFSTHMDLLALAKKYEYNVGFAIGPCSKDGVVDNGKGLGYVYWDKGIIYAYTRDKDVPGYAEMAAKRQPFTYHVYAGKLPQDPSVSLCLTLRGGNMVGGRLRSNDAEIPVRP